MPISEKVNALVDGGFPSFVDTSGMFTPIARGIMNEIGPDYTEDALTTPFHIEWMMM